jgi:DNA-binding NtrC family response regulator
MSEFKVLLIDDEQELVSTLVERLQFRDIDAAYELTGSSAIERMRREKFDVVVLDLKLPGISGSETMRVINKEHPNVPVLIITGHGSSAEMQDMPKGAADYLAKPINIDDLIEKMRNAMNKK